MKRFGVFVLLAGMCGCSSSGSDAGESSGALALSERQVNVYVLLDGPAAVDAVPLGVPIASPKGTAAIRRRMQEAAAQRQQIVPEITSLGGIVVADVVRLANVLQVVIGESRVPELARIAGVTSVEPVPYYEPSLTSAVPVVGAPTLWQAATPFDGDGITIGIIDSGIDYTHADFGGAGTQAAYTANDSTLVEPGSFPTAKVVGGHDFVGNDYFPTTGLEVPAPDPDPLDCLKPQSMQVAGGHGTHVAGIAAGVGVTTDSKPFAGPYNQSFNPSQFRIGPGVAPKAKLYALKIFGCQGGTQMLAPALERAADPNEDGDLSDRLDVVNASLGTSYSLSSVAQDTIIENLVGAGTVFVAAAGNEGDAFFATSSPGSNRATLSVAASADSQLILLDVTAPANIAGAMPAAEGGFTTRLVDSGPKSGEVVLTQPANGCSTLQNASALAGKIALFDRGDCQFISKFNRAVNAGAIAAIVVDDEDQPVPFAMGGGDPGEVPIPGVMIKKSDGDVLKGALAQGVTITMDGTKLFTGPGSELLAGFSSRGPSAIDARLKPEVAAPGFAIDSARVGSGANARRSQGTSMASPMVAGAAALLRQAHPTFSALEVKAALVNSAAPLTDLDGNVYPASSIGAGRIAVDRAAQLKVTAAADSDGTVGMSFGLIEATEPLTLERTVSVTNHGSASVDYTVSAEPAAGLAGVIASIEPATLSLAPGASSTVTLRIAVDPAALPAPAPDPTTPALQFEQPRHFLTETSGHVRLTSSASPDQSLGVPYFAAVKHGLERKAQPLPACPTGGSGDGTVAIELEGPTGNVTPAVSAFQLGATHARHPDSDTDPKRALLDVLAVGAATDLAGKAHDYFEASVFFGVAIAGEWLTPAQGVRSVANVYIDSDDNGSANYLVRAEAFSRDGPYIDVLTATTYDVSTGEPTESRRFLNMLPATTLNTQPFGNSVVVLPVFLRDIGITEENPVIWYSAFTQSENPFEQGEQTEWAKLDVSKPAVDTALSGIETRPVFSGDSITVHLSPDAGGEPLPQLLLLHHTNKKGQRYEILDLVDPDQPTGNIALAASAPETASVGEPLTFTLTASNPETSIDAQVTLEGTLSGATVATLDPRCTKTSDTAFECDLGTLSPGTESPVEVEAIATEAGVAGGAELSAIANVSIACELSTADNSATASVAITGTGDGEPDDELEPGGGCACRAGSAHSSRAGLLAFALGAALFARRRRTRR